MKTLNCWLRVCAMCSSGWGRRDLFCEPCWEKLWHLEQQNRGYFVAADFPVSVLWNWSETSKTIEHFVRAQKSTGLTEARERIFRRYLTFALGERPSMIVYVIPHNKPQDHASEGAQVLAKLLGVRAHALKIKPREKYKMKGRRERGQAQGIIDHCVSVRGERLWFYDDVITTGSTAKAVWEALGKPQAFQAVALVYRARRIEAKDR